MKTVHLVADLRSAVREWRRVGESVALVPTMGGLHDGHLSLITQARETGDRVIATIFVNPTQFGPDEDLTSYPSDLEHDSKLLTGVGADLLFAPAAAEIYPTGFSTAVHVSGLTDCLCGAHRPGHFSGVATVVTKLLMQSLPDMAIFGEKDYQQLQVIRHFVRDLDIPVQIMGGTTVREPDGLAMSSRNAYLTAEERTTAPTLYQVLTDIAARAADGTTDCAQLCMDGRDRLISAGFGPIDYLEVRAADTLALVDTVDRPARIFAAAHLGRARLIDNVAVD